MTEEQELILNLFRQGCQQGGLDDPQYDHMCLSAYEDAQEYLLKHCIISEKDCTRGV